MNRQTRILLRLLACKHRFRGEDKNRESSSRVVLCEMQENVEKCWSFEFSRSVDLYFDDILDEQVCSAFESGKIIRERE